MNEYDRARISWLRDRAVSPDVCHDEFFLLFHKYFDNMGEGFSEERYGDAFIYAFSNMTPVIADDELIVGRSLSKLSDGALEEWKGKYRDIAVKTARNSGDGQDSHMAIDYHTLLELGINGIADKAERLLENAESKEKALFYSNCLKCLKAVLILSEKYSRRALELANACDDERRRNELLELSRICEKVPANPPENFHEAVQSVHFVTYCVSLNPLRYCWQQFQLGRPDRYLLPYYEKGISEGTLTDEQAQVLFDCLAIQINNRVPRGLSSGYMVGGRDGSGNTVANRLTEIGLQAIDDLHLVYPSVGLCYHRDMSEHLLEKSCEILSHGCSHPAIFNDDIIAAGLKEYGVPEGEARDYIHSTCVEITPIALSNVWVASPYTNLPGLLLDIMDREYDSFESLSRTYYEKLSESIKENFDGQNRLREIRAKNSMNPLLSCFVNDCLELGLDIERGGGRYNWIMPSFVGMGNLVDSLYTVKTVVFDRKEMTLKELKDILEKNFEDDEALRLRLLSKLPKYGNDEDCVDGLADDFARFIVEECKKHTPIHRNARLVPSVFCWEMHEYFGRETGATPDGRKAGFPLGDGSGPCQGREKRGPTAAILSSTKWSHKELIGGVAVNVKFGKKYFREGSVQKVAELVKTYIDRGGFELQINVVDAETLKKAQADPENYADLVVRIGGYSDYFVKLTPNMQAEVMLRTTYEI